MLRIRLTRTGKKSQVSYRIVVAEHTAPIKGKFVEVVGHYALSRQPRQLMLEKDRIKHWLSVGAQPTDTVACLLKKEGFESMDRFIAPRTLKRKRKKGGDEPAAQTVAQNAPQAESTPLNTETLEPESTSKQEVV